MRWIVGGKAAQRSAASPSQMGRFETQWLAAPKNFAALADLSGQWIDLVHGRRPPRGIVLDMDSSVSPTHGEPTSPPCAPVPCNFGYQAGTWTKPRRVIARTRLSCRTFAANAVRLQLHALAYNLGNFLRTLATTEPIKDWSLTSLKDKLIKIGAKVVSHGRYVIFQMAEVAIARQMFQEILRLIAELRPQPPPAPA